jgi:hypothetical protein
MVSGFKEIAPPPASEVMHRLIAKSYRDMELARQAKEAQEKSEVFKTVSNGHYADLPRENQETKRCCDCNLELPSYAFGWKLDYTRTKYILRTYCRECERERNRSARRRWKPRGQR